MIEDWVEVLLTPAVVAAVVAGGVALLTRWSNVQQAARQRQIETWAEAFKAYVAYKEFPFLVRRRSPEDPAGERVRLSTALSEVQQQLSYFSSWAGAESRRVGAIYDHLISEARRVAGPAIAAGWDRAPVDSDRAMHVRDVDLGELDEAEKLFRLAVHLHLHPVRSRLHRGDRKLRAKVTEVIETSAGPEPRQRRRTAEEVPDARGHDGVPASGQPVVADEDGDVERHLAGGAVREA